MHPPQIHRDIPESKELIFAHQLALEAGKIMQNYFDIDQQTITKNDGTPVTIADKEINSLVIKSISKMFPGDGIVGEEESTTCYGDGRRWICDPIDGTAAYVIGLPSAMFSLCLVIDGLPEVAVAYEPQRQQFFHSLKGHGSYCNSTKLKVSSDDITNGIIGLAPDYIRPKFIDGKFMKKLLALNKPLAIFPGAVFRSCLVASGRVAGFPHPNVKPYDIAAVHLIVTEAGGKVTGLLGEELDYATDFRGAILSNGVVHEDLLELCK